MIKELLEMKINEEQINYQDQFVVNIVPEKGVAVLLSMFGFFTKYPVVLTEKELGKTLSNKIKKIGNDYDKFVDKVEMKEVDGIMVLTLHTRFVSKNKELKLKYIISNGDMKIVEE